MKKTNLKRQVVDLIINKLTHDLQTDYRLLTDLIIAYRDRIKPDEVQNIFATIVNEFELDNYQDEIITEISNRLSGFSANHVKIEL